MKRWEAAEFGEPEMVLSLVDVEAPEPAADEALVRVLAASVALPDLMMVRGQYMLVTTPPVSPGQEVVGIVEQAGEGFAYPPGTRIIGGARFDAGTGGLAEYTIVPGWSAMPVMDGLSDEQAVGFVGSFHVAHIGLEHRASLQPGEVLLVLGGAGRTGSAAIQVAKAMGATVIATARSEAKAAFCAAQGADLVIDLNDSSWRDKVTELTAGRGIDVLYDTVGGQAFTDAASALAPGARVLVVGFASGEPAAIDTMHMLFNDYSVAGVLSVFRTDAEREASTSWFSEKLASGEIAPPVNAVYSFAEVPEALVHRDANGAGQTVVVIADGRDDL